ncbi:hypothetical protein YC2023_045543 [Brassica napus]
MDTITTLCGLPHPKSNPYTPNRVDPATDKSCAPGGRLLINAPIISGSFNATVSSNPSTESLTILAALKNPSSPINVSAVNGIPSDADTQFPK